MINPLFIYKHKRFRNVLFYFYEVLHVNEISKKTTVKNISLMRTRSGIKPFDGGRYIPSDKYTKICLNNIGNNVRIWNNISIEILSESEFQENLKNESFNYKNNIFVV